MAESLTCRPTFADVIAIGLIAWSSSYTAYMLNDAGESVVALQLIVLAMGLIALYGMRELKTTGSSVKLWFVIGLHIAMAPLGIFSVGLGPIFSTGIMIAYAAFRARHLGVPTIDRWGLLAEVMGFSIPYAFFLWAA